jgi:hypothetical protein
MGKYFIKQETMAIFENEENKEKIKKIILYIRVILINQKHFLF